MLIWQSSVPSVMMLPVSSTSDHAVLLTSKDFPDHFVHMKHPEDYIPVASPIIPECTVHSNDQNLRLIMRIAWKIDRGFLPMSFILDTGAMSDIYLSMEGLSAIEKYNLVKRDGRDERFLKLQFGKKNDQLTNCYLENTPKCY
jgi:hypothetical protein